MIHDPEQLTATRQRVEASLGGRFRDGAECPRYVLDLFELAQAEAANQPAENADFLHEHFEVCPVCRRIYQSALAAAKRTDDDGFGDPVSPAGSVASGQVPSLSCQASALALGDGAVGGQGQRFLDLEVRRADATYDASAPQTAGPPTTVTLLWTAEAKLQLGLAGFLVPAAGERVAVQWMSGADELLDRLEIAGGAESTADFPRPPRAPADGDRLRFQKWDPAGNVVWDVSVTVKDGPAEP